MNRVVVPFWRRPLVWIGFILLGVVLIWGGFFSWQLVRSVRLLRSGSVDPLADLARQQFAASVSQEFAKSATTQDLTHLEAKDQPTLGSSQAPVHLVEFVDFDCPFCQQVASTLRMVVARHPNEVYLMLRDFPLVELHPNAQHSAMAARCVFLQGNMSRYWRYYDRLFATQGVHGVSDLRIYASQVGVDLSRFDACIASQEPLAAIRQSLADGVAAGVQGTPTFFFNGVKIQGALDEQALETVIREAVRRARASS